MVTTNYSLGVSKIILYLQLLKLSHLCLSACFLMLRGWMLSFWQVQLWLLSPLIHNSLHYNNRRLPLLFPTSSWLLYQLHPPKWYLHLLHNQSPTWNTCYSSDLKLTLNFISLQTHYHPYRSLAFSSFPKAHLSRYY
jgi:hypothetical protein